MKNFIVTEKFQCHESIYDNCQNSVSQKPFSFDKNQPTLWSKMFPSKGKSNSRTANRTRACIACIWARNNYLQDAYNVYLYYHVDSAFRALLFLIPHFIPSILSVQAETWDWQPLSSALSERAKGIFQISCIKFPQPADLSSSRGKRRLCHWAGLQND